MKLKRTISLAAVGGIALFALTGCMSMNVAVTVAPDGETATMSYSTSYNKKEISSAYSMSDSMSGESDSVTDVCELIKSSMENDTGATVVFTENKTQCIATYEPITVKYDKSGIKSISEENELTTSENVFITKESDDTSKVKFDFASMDNEDAMNFGSLDSTIDEFDVTVNFPGKVIEANLDGVISDDGHSVTWKKDSVLTSINSGGTLSVTGELKELNIAPLLYSLGGALLLSGLIVTAAIFSQRSKKLAPKNEATETE